MNYTYYRRYKPQQRKKSSFRSFFWLVVFLVAIALFSRACVSFFSVLTEEKRDDAVLSIERGDVSVILWGQSEMESASDSQIILKGDSVLTGEDSYAFLRFQNGTELAIDENSHLVFADAVIGGAEGGDSDYDSILLELKDGRVWLDHLPKENGQLQIELQTDVMNVTTVSGQYLASNVPDDEYLYVFEGQADTDFVDRSSTSKVIETEILNVGEKVTMSDNKQRALLSRENVVLAENREDGELTGDEFVMWNLGTLILDEDVVDEEEGVEEEEIPEEDLTAEEEPAQEEPIAEEEEPDVTDEEAIDEIAENLVIAVTSPSSPANVEKDAIAIEGKITSGTAASVYVSWSGNGEYYALSLFEAGDGTFRYVADDDYLNFAPGQNTYTIVAYDADGNASNVVTVVINADF